MDKRNVQVGKITNNRGRINITTGMIVENIQHIYERSLTAAEGKAKARSIEYRLLAQGVGALLKRMRHAAETPPARSPYKGLLYYELADAGVFFGRQRDIENVLSCLDRGPFTILYSESGSGKTSLLQAGIVPRLIARGALPIYLRSNEANPSLAIKRVFLPDLKPVPHLAKAPLRDFLQRVSEIIGSGTTLYLFLDQFEEFFTRTPERDRQAFIREMADCIDNSSLNVRWLISMRKEYFGHIEAFIGRIRNPYENYYFLNKLTRDQAREAIARSARKFGLSLEAGLTDRILDDLGGASIIPPELQLVCRALYEGTQETKKELTIELYEKEGAATGILRDHLKRVLNRDIPPAKRPAAQQVLESLVTSVPQRAVRSHAELLNELTTSKIPPEDVDTVLNQLVNSRLVRAEETETGLKYELVHDYLLGEIKIDHQTRQRKRAEELLAQGTANWKQDGVLLGRDALELIDRERKRIKPDPEEAQLFILSALEQKMDARPWRSFLDREARRKVIEQNAARLDHPDKRTRQRANELLWFFAADQPGPMRRRYLLREVTRRGVVQVLPRASVYSLLLLVGLVFFVVLGIFSSSLTGGWREVATLAEQCLSGAKPGALEVSIDPIDDSRFAAYDRTRDRLCLSTDAGSSWTEVTGRPSGTVREIAAGDGLLFLASDRGLYTRGFSEGSWTPLSISGAASGEIEALAVNPREGGEALLAASPKELFRVRDIPKEPAAERLDTAPITGQVTGLATDGNRIVLATTEGLWFSDYAEIAWQPVRGLEPQEGIRSIVVYEENFYLVTADHRITTGEFERGVMLGAESEGKYPLPQWPDLEVAVNSLAATGSVTLVGNGEGLQCYAYWNWLHSEWWRLMFFKNKPCR